MNNAERSAAKTERMKRYADLRQAGILQADACREVGIDYSGAGARYERWYRETYDVQPKRRSWNLPP